MFYKKLRSDDLLNKNYDDKQVVDLLTNDNSSLKLISVKKNDGFNSKISHTDIFIYIIDGEIELTFPQKMIDGCCLCGCELSIDDDKTAIKHVIGKNQMFMFKKDITHNLKALKDCKFLLVKI